MLIKNIILKMVLNMKKNLRTVKTTMIMGILLVSVLTSMMSVSSVQGGLFSFAHVIEIDWLDIDNATLPIKPFEETRSYKIEIKYSIIKGPLGTLIYNFFYRGRQVNIQLEIVSYPSEWSTVTMLDNTITFGLPNDVTEEKSFTHELLVSLDDKAPAFKRGIIKINVSVPKIGMIEGTSEQVELSITPDYAPQLNIVPESENIEISPYIETKIPIKITNLGNGQTRVFAELENASENWNVSIDDIIIDVDQTIEIFLTVITDHKFDTESIILKFTPAWSENLNLRGESRNIELSFINDGSYKEDLGFKIDTTLLIIVFHIIILSIISLFLLRKRKQ